MAAPEDVQQIWSNALQTVRDEGMRRSELALVNLARPLGLLDDTLLLAVPTDFVKDTLETTAREALVAAISMDGTARRFAVTIDPSLQDAPPQATHAEAHGGPAAHVEAHNENDDRPLGTPVIDRDYASRDAEWAARDQRAARDVRDARDAHRTAEDMLGATTSSGPRSSDPSRLNPKYTFETFVIGSSNRFAHAAATAVAEAPAKAYNPLFIYGGSGLGKTHLLHAIGHYARNLYPGIYVRYVNSEEFTNDFINSIRDDKPDMFQRRYREVDLLLIDDIQFLGGKEQTVEEFFHTFNTLHNNNKQVVITSDVPPKQLDGFEDRLRSRFEWGLLTDVQPPDLETRIAILRKKAINEDLQISNEVMQYIAERIATNIRELEGALIRVTAFANLNRQPVELSLAEMVLKDLISDPEGEEITPALIMSQTAVYFAVSIDALRSTDRSRVLVNARQIAMYLCRELTELSFPKIGQVFGGRDHTTVMHAEKKIRQKMPEDRKIFTQVTELTNRIKQKARES